MPEPRRLVRVARSDAPSRRADLELAELRLAGVVEHHVVGHDQVRVGRDPQQPRIHSAPAQFLQLVGQHPRIDHHPVADHAHRVLVQDARRDQVQLERLAAPHDRVPGVVAALEADHGIRPLGEQIGDLPLSFITPLGANQYDSGHRRRSVRTAWADPRGDWRDFRRAITPGARTRSFPADARPGHPGSGTRSGAARSRSHSAGAHARSLTAAAAPGPADLTPTTRDPPGGQSRLPRTPVRGLTFAACRGG